MSLCPINQVPHAYGIMSEEIVGTKKRNYGDLNKDSLSKVGRDDRTKKYLEGKISKTWLLVDYEG